MGILILLMSLAVLATIAAMVARYFRGGIKVLVLMATFMVVLGGALLWSWLSTQRVQFY